MDFSKLCGRRLRHALAHADSVYKLVVKANLPCYQAAKMLRLEKEQVEGLARLLKHTQRVPSPERLAVIAQLDPGLDDEDIAEMFGRTKRWSELVRMHAAELRKAEPIPSKLEYLDEGLQPDYPTPEQIYAEAARLRMSKTYFTDEYVRPYEPTVMSWRGNAFVPTPFLSSVFA